MQYRKNIKNGDELSQLGLGCMRLPRRGGQIDQEKTNAIVRLALEGGVNYFDTAYIYPGAESALGIALAATGRRGDVKIATKLPHHFCKKNQDLEKIFTKQLERLQTDYIDYYLIHNISDVGTWERLKALGVEQWLAEKISSGKIRNAGFSYHGGRDGFKSLLNAYNWNFCMIQYNYLDEFNQAGREGLRAANEKGLPVFIMEPLRGGMLVNGLPKDATDIFAKAKPGQSMAEWGLRWLWNQPEVTMVLSGMSTPEMLEENLRIADKAAIGTLSETELAAYADAVKATTRAVKVNCTGCGYCMPCPAGVDIPTCFSCYNESYTLGYYAGIKRYFMTTGAMAASPSNASLCVKCGKCEKHCPQGIEIRKRLAEASGRMESFWYRPAMSVIRRVVLPKSKGE